MTLSHEVECDEAYVVAGHKGQPEVVKSTGRKGRRRRRKSQSGRGTMAKEKGSLVISGVHIILKNKGGSYRIPGSYVTSNSMSA